MNRPLFLVLAVALGLPACIREPRPAVSLSFRQNEAPGDASVTIDEEYVGPLAFVAAHGVRLPIGRHRISIEKSGYFPQDLVVVSDREPVRIDVRLEKLPD